jgi:tetratricopeptide (TPR) repeat protein
VTGTGDWPGDGAAPMQVSELPVAERRVLAALAIVGRASLSADELAELAEVENIAPLVADLERHGFIRREDTQRYAALGRAGEAIRQADSALATGERLLQYVTTLAKGDPLTPGGLLDDAEALLGLTEWASEMQQWERLLELVKTLQACIGMVNRVEEWLTLLDRGLAAARALGDWQSEVWVLQQLATASAGAGDPSTAQRHLREAYELQRRHDPSLPRDRSDREISTSQPTTVGVGGGKGGARIALWTLCLIAAATAAIGGATGYAIGNSASAGGHTVTTFKTVTLPARTVTTSKTVTLPPTTVFSTTTVTTTVTTTTPPPTTRSLPGE